MKPATEILLSAAFVLTPRRHWTKYAFERDCRFCAREAMRLSAVAMGYGYQPIADAVNIFSNANGRTPIGFNDHPYITHAEVLAALYKAAELSEAS